MAGVEAVGGPRNLCLGKVLEIVDASVGITLLKLLQQGRLL